MELSRRELGDWGERISKTHLERKGYEIIELNYQKRDGEIDVIARSNDDCLVFFEVKTRTMEYGKYGLPEESITYYKQRKLMKTAQLFIYEKGYNQLEINWRFDVLVVIIDIYGKKAKIRHIKNAFAV